MASSTLPGLSLPSRTHNERGLEPYIIHALAAVTLACILWLNALVWPVEWLGFTYASAEDRVSWVEPGSAAARAGVQVGDRFLSIYGVPFAATEYYPYLRDLIDRNHQVRVEAERDGQLVVLTLERHPPTWETQADILVYTAIALSCWLVGYVLGVTRRTESRPYPAVALFWTLLGAWLGAVPFAGSLSLPLYAALYCVFVTVIFPLGIYVHAEFPRRHFALAKEHWLKRALLSYVLGTTSIAIAIIWLSRPRPSVIVSTLSDMLLFSVLALFLVSGLLLWSEHRRTTIAHVQRQIRIIGSACFIAAAGWLLLSIVPTLLYSSNAFLTVYSNLVVLPIPLAYLAAGISTDLYRLDRLARILLSHLLALVALSLAAAGLIALLNEQNPSQLLWLILVCVLLYRPIQRFCYRRIGLDRQGPQRYQPLGAALARAATTLDENDIWKACERGLTETFDNAPRAFYRYCMEEGRLHLLDQYRLPYLPAHVHAGALTAALAEAHDVRFARDVARDVERCALSPDETRLLTYQGIVLWCPLVNAHQQLLGVIMLGQQPNLDAYRPEDITFLQSFADALGLAFANSYAFQQSQEQTAKSQEQTEKIRSLLQHLQSVQDATSAAIAHRLHDDVINISMRFNLLAIDDLLAALPPELESHRKALMQIREAEAGMERDLRMVCEDLHPPGVDEPLGLPIVLQADLQQLRLLWQVWKGSLSFSVTSEPLPLSPDQQLTCLRITREAVTNAIKHAQAAEICVRLTYPTTADGDVVLEVRDNGIGTVNAARSKGHFGVRNMREAATRIGGTFQLDGSDGTCVTVRFPCTCPPSVMQ